MKQVIKRNAAAVIGFGKSRPREVRWSIYGMALGGTAGVLVGGVGIAALGGAMGVPAALVLAIVGGMIGNRIGVGKDRPLQK